MSLQLAFSVASIVLCFATSIPKPSEKQFEKQNLKLRTALLLFEDMNRNMEEIKKSAEEIKKSVEEIKKQVEERKKP